MALEIEGKVVKVMPEQSGEGKAGVWVKQEFVIETPGEFPKKVCFNTWGDKTRNVKSLVPGETVRVSFEPASREYMDKWFTDLRAWKIEKLSGAPAGSAPTSYAQPQSATPSYTQPQAPVAAQYVEELPPSGEEDDLPF